MKIIELGIYADNHIILFSLFLAGCENDGNLDVADRTLIVYMIADNDLASEAFLV